jgi:hypothetical protein
MFDLSDLNFLEESIINLIDLYKNNKHDHHPCFLCKFAIKMSIKYKNFKNVDCSFCPWVVIEGYECLGHLELSYDDRVDRLITWVLKIKEMKNERN